MDIDSNHISPSFGDRPVPYANWHYLSVEWTTSETEGYHSQTARHAHTSRSREVWEEFGKARIGSTLGYGDHAGETITNYRVVESEYTLGKGVIRIKEDAHLLLRAKLSQHRNPAAGYNHEEHASMDWLRRNKLRVFSLMEEVPQMTAEQFFNTYPEVEDPHAPAGYFIPRGLAEVIK